MKDYGAALKHLRTNRGMSMQVVADQLGVSKNLVSLIEMNRSNSEKYLDQLSDIYGVSKTTIEELAEIVESSFEEKKCLIEAQAFYDRMSEVASLLDMSVSSLSTGMGLGPSYLSHVKTKHICPTEAVLHKVSKYLEIPIDDLIDTQISIPQLFVKYDVLSKIRYSKNTEKLLKKARELKMTAVELDSPFENSESEIDHDLIQSMLNELSNTEIPKEVRYTELFKAFTGFMVAPNTTQEDINMLITFMKRDTE